MNGFFQLMVAWGVLLLFVLMLYMIDKFNFVFSNYAQADTPQTYTDGLFGELYGKPLWDAMSGLPIPGIEKKLVESLKPHYEPVLRQHIEQVFMEGYQHAREATLGVPSNNRMIPTPRGALESWLPLHHLSSIYQAGADFYSTPDSDVLRIQQNLDQITSMLYARVGISLLDPYSRTLMVHPVGVDRSFTQFTQTAGVSSGTPTASSASADSLPAQGAPVQAVVGTPVAQGIQSQVASLQGDAQQSVDSPPEAWPTSAANFEVQADEKVFLEPNLASLSEQQVTQTPA
jgi:hypothetical protein